MVERINSYINEAGPFFLATEDGNQPKIRPLGAHVLKNGQLYFFIGDFKDVYKQMTANPLVEIVAFKKDDMTWLRYTGKAVFDSDEELAQQVIAGSANLQKTYNEETGYKLMIFHLENAQAALYKVGNLIEKL